MEAKTLNCPMCGAAARSDATHCEHCGARLATVACPSCFDLMFEGQKFCPNCGAAAQRVELDPGKRQPCPRCNEELRPVDIGGTRLRECGRCDGLWIDNETFEEICRKREQQTVFMGIPALQNPQTAVTLDPVKYLKCPECVTLMNRVNFAGCSGVIVDICRSHGTWFDRAELRRIIDFIQAGGMDRAREREMRRLASERQVYSAERVANMATVDRTTGSAWSGSVSSGELGIIGTVAQIAWDYLTTL